MAYAGLVLNKYIRVALISIFRACRVCVYLIGASCSVSSWCVFPKVPYVKNVLIRAHSFVQSLKEKSIVGNRVLASRTAVKMHLLLYLLE